MSLREQATAEMLRADFASDDIAAVEQIMTIFFKRWDSGGAVNAMLPILLKCFLGEPLTPLTGADDEWMNPVPEWDLLQNRRCGHVFKSKHDGRAWNCNTGEDNIVFPYMPRSEIAAQIDQATCPTITVIGRKPSDPTDSQAALGHKAHD